MQYEDRKRRMQIMIEDDVVLLHCAWYIQPSRCLALNGGHTMKRNFDSAVYVTV